MSNYKVTHKHDGNSTVRIIKCREMTIEHGSYCFWTGDHGATNRLAWAFPIMFTIIEGLPDTEEI
jgi:hypothetical protein